MKTSRLIRNLKMSPTLQCSKSRSPIKATPNNNCTKSNVLPKNKVIKESFQVLHQQAIEVNVTLKRENLILFFIERRTNLYRQVSFIYQKNIKYKT